MKKNLQFIDNIIFCHKYILGDALVSYCINSAVIIIGNLFVHFMQTFLLSFVVNLLVSGKDFLPILGLLVCYVLGLYLLTIIIKRLEASVSKDINNRRMLRGQDYSLSLCKIAYENLDNSEFRVKYEAGKESYFDGDHTGFHNYMLDFRMLLLSVSGLFMYCTMIAKVDFRIALMEICLSAIILLINLLRKKWLIAHQNEWNTLDMKLNYISRESIDSKNAKEVRLYPIRNWFLSKWDELSATRLHWYGKEQIFVFFTKWGEDILTAIKYGFACVMIIKQVAQGMPVNDFVLSIGLIMGMNKWTSQIFESLQFLQLNTIHIKNTRIVLEHDSETPLGDFTPTTKDKRVPEIRFENVSYRFPESSEYVIKNLNLVIHPGEKIAIVGNNGAGKTTLIKLLCGLYRPTEGNIYVDNIDISSMTPQEYYEQISVVFQDFHILATTILENISCKTFSEADVSRANNCLSLAGLSKYIDSLPHGILSNMTKELDPDGVVLSGGQLQKLIIARCLYKNAPILILDEPTSSLDSLAESMIYQEYHALTVGKTSVFISHRLSSTRFCDRIIVLKHGKIIEEGTHEQLLNQNGEYKQMYMMQSSYYQEG